MNRAWNRLVQRKQFPAVGFVRSTEVTRGQAADAHPHFHCLLLVPSSYFGGHYIKQAEWRELWQSVLKVDYLPVVNVKAVKPKPGDDLTQGVAIAILETLKYGVKVDDLISDQDWLIELTHQLHKTRAVAVGGVLKEFLSEEEPENLITNAEDTEVEVNNTDIDVWFGWREMVKRYIKTERC
jgi:hypothetical protein